MRQPKSDFNQVVGWIAILFASMMSAPFLSGPWQLGSDGVSDLVWAANMGLILLVFLMGAYTIKEPSPVGASDSA